MFSISSTIGPARELNQGPTAPFKQTLYQYATQPTTLSQICVHLATFGLHTKYSTTCCFGYVRLTYVANSETFSTTYAWKL